MPNVCSCYHTEGMHCLGFKMAFQKGGGYPSIFLLHDSAAGFLPRLCPNLRRHLKFVPAPAYQAMRFLPLSKDRSNSDLSIRIHLAEKDTEVKVSVCRYV